MLRGDAEAVKGVGSGKVLKHHPEGSHHFARAATLPTSEPTWTPWGQFSELFTTMLTQVGHLSSLRAVSLVIMNMGRVPTAISNGTVISCALDRFMI